MKVAVVGATGMVGREMLKQLEERDFPVSSLLPIASEKSAGKLINFKNNSIPVIGIESSLDVKADIALFSAGSDISLKWAPKFSNNGTIVIDNSSAWRMDPKIKLIIPEINSNILTKKDTIIANPNCSTIQMLMVLAPLYKQFGISRLLISTYQSITGTGIKAVNQLENEYKNIKGEMAYHYPIHKNAIPHCDDFLENGYTKEEMKLVNETHKILSDNKINISATAVRIPVVGGHSESINVELKKPSDIKDIFKILNNCPGVVVEDNPSRNNYPMPIYSEGKNEVFVGRIRYDISRKNAYNMWIVADNLRKGAATNAIQIAEYLKDNF